MEVGLPRFAARTIEEVTNFREVVRLSTSIQGFDNFLVFRVKLLGGELLIPERTPEVDEFLYFFFQVRLSHPPLYSK